MPLLTPTAYRRLLSLNELRDPSLPAVATQAIERMQTVVWSRVTTQKY